MSDRVENRFELSVVTQLKGVQLSGKFLIRGQDSPHANERSHDLDIDQDGPFTAENA